VDVSNQPRGRMTVMSLPEHLRNVEWDGPQEIEIRLAGELILYGLTDGVAMHKCEASCVNPDCAGHCVPRETLHLEIDITAQEAS
jgi:hypothetical protein